MHGDKVNLSMFIETAGLTGLGFLDGVDLRGIMGDLQVALIETLFDTRCVDAPMRLLDLEGEPLRIVINIKDGRVIGIGHFMLDKWLTEDDVLDHIKKISRVNI